MCAIIGNIKCAQEHIMIMRWRRREKQGALITHAKDKIFPTVVALLSLEQWHNVHGAKRPYAT